MAMRVETNPLEAAYAVLLENGLDGAGEAQRILVKEAAKIGRAVFLGARPYERTASRRDDCPRLQAQDPAHPFGEVTFRVPQVRAGDFYPSALEKGTLDLPGRPPRLGRDECQGVSTRRVIDVL
jgi:transposase-like protein